MKLVEIPPHVETCRNLVGNEFVDVEGPLQDVRSPWTGEVISRVPMSTPGDVARVLSAASQGARVWGRVPIKERTQVLFRWRELLLQNIEKLGHYAAAESGKTPAEGMAGVMKGIEVLEFALALQNLDAGGAMDVSRGVSCEYRRMPLGVVAGIAPFNFPAMVPMWMYPIAIALGNAFVLKPSEKVPLTSMRMAELAVEAGLPSGVFSVVHGGADVVRQLCAAPEVQALGFVGSTPIARAVYSAAATHGKRALALGGAKNHLIVVPDADLEVTVDGIVKSCTGCAGQRCMAASLMIAVGDVDHIIDAVVERAGQLRLGTDLGAIITPSSKARMHEMVTRAQQQGATLRLDGRDAVGPSGYEGGYWFGATIIDHARPDMECAREEIFGPVLTIVRVNSLSEAMALENASPYGNATSVFTTNGQVAQFVADRATNGMVGVNIGVPVPREPFSFGGTKESKFGQGDITGESSLDLWSNLKKITMKWSLQNDQTWMS